MARLLLKISSVFLLLILTSCTSLLYYPDKERMYYISGPHAMVTAYQDLLSSLHIPKSHIMVDYFPGFV